MKNFADWFKMNYPGEELPQDSINGKWFAEKHLPMVVRCACCSTTMALPSAYLDDEDYAYCSCCAGVE